MRDRHEHQLADESPDATTALAGWPSTRLHAPSSSGSLLAESENGGERSILSGWGNSTSMRSLIADSSADHDVGIQAPLATCALALTPPRQVLENARRRCWHGKGSAGAVRGASASGNVVHW
jgi:hypothetical protein